jgi:predicted ester cyclase
MRRRPEREGQEAAPVAGVTRCGSAASAASPGGGSTGSGSSSRITAESASGIHGISQVNKRIVQRYTSEYLHGRKPAPASKFVSPDIVVHFGGQIFHGRETYLGVVAANLVAFPDLKWTVEDIRAEDGTVAVRYSITGTHRGPLAGVEGTGKVMRSESRAFYRRRRPGRATSDDRIRQPVEQT